MDLHRKKEGICQSLANLEGLRTCYWNTGLLLRKRGEHQPAVEKLKKAIELDERLRHPDLEKDRNGAVSGGTGGLTRTPNYIRKLP